MNAAVMRVRVRPSARSCHFQCRIELTTFDPVSNQYRSINVATPNDRITPDKAIRRDYEPSFCYNAVVFHCASEARNGEKSPPIIPSTRYRNTVTLPTRNGFPKIANLTYITDN